MSLKTEDIVLHPRLGEGRVRLVDAETVVVRFQSGLEECLARELVRVAAPAEKVASRHLDDPLPTIAHVMASCIRSVNDEWGVFASSRVVLLPHQLWVCRQVLERWPMRWLVADDVGLGKTVEAGLILSSLFAAGRLRRLLVLAPASLVQQWQHRMLTMFDLRLEIYVPENDTKKTQFWRGARMIAASMETLRTNTNERWKRLLEAEPWDVVIVDEAHRMNADERTGQTLSYTLLYELEQHGKINSLLFFSGTPHRGKDYGFLSLLNLLKPGHFDPATPIEEVLEKIPEVMIRNNKQKVTDMQGRKLFTPVHTHKINYAYSQRETAFYAQLTDFITSGRAYAQGLAAQQQRVMIFVLLTMQKLASSSIAAVKKALRNRLARLEGDHSATSAAASTMEATSFAEQECEDGGEELAAQAIGTIPGGIALPQEIASLHTLLALAEDIESETKIIIIVEKILTEHAGESILLFTEYKATQALLVNALRTAFGPDSTTFINGDGALEFVNSTGESVTEHVRRDRAADDFNKGAVRFLVSTEAAGEGIDLQQHCCTLFHVDLPWNPMRLHQRVGRLSRYGQELPVHVYIFRNPETVESRIWECLEVKLQRITLAFQGAMEDPEDMCQVVIGMSSNDMFATLFGKTPQKNDRQDLQHWFDAQTATFGGQDVVSLVKRLFGSVQRFDFGTMVENLPRLDLVDLLPYFKITLTRLKRLWTDDGAYRISFKTPEPWLEDVRFADEYHLVFSREAVCSDKEDLAGMGFVPVNRAVEEALNLRENCCALRGLDAPLFVFRMRDRATAEATLVRQRIVGVKRHLTGWRIYKDWELLLFLNRLAGKPRALLKCPPAAEHPDPGDFTAAEQQILASMGSLNVPFRVPYLEHLACLCPTVATTSENYCEGSVST